MVSIQVSNHFKSIFIIAKISFYLIIPLILLIIPADFFDKGKTICLSVYFFNTQCPGCGMTRSIQHLIHGEFEIAASFNKLSFIVLPVLIYLLIENLISQLKILIKIRNKLLSNKNS